MRELLSAHPNIYITHEPWFYIWNDLCPKEYSGDEFLKYYFQTFSFRWLRLKPADVLKNLDRHLPREQLWLAFREIMQQKARALGRERYGEKTPGHMDHLGEIFRDFPDARVVLMLRDPRSTVESTRRQVWGCQRDLGNCLVYERSRKKAQKFEDRLLTVKLEALRLNPEREMRRILDFVGEPWDSAVLDHAANNPDPNDMPPVPWLQSAAEPLVPSEMRLPAISPERLRLIETICGGSMKRYGYEKAVLESEPSTVETWRRIVGEVPETARYAWTMIKIYQKLRDPHRWGSAVASYGHVFANLNRPWWNEHKDMTFPIAPELDLSDETTFSANEPG